MFTLMIKTKFLITASQSLKEKRSVVRSIKERLRFHYKVTIAETGELYKWQIGELGMALVSSDYSYLQDIENKMRDYLEGNFPVELLSWEFDLVKFEDE